VSHGLSSGSYGTHNNFLTRVWSSGSFARVLKHVCDCGLTLTEALPEPERGVIQQVAVSLVATVAPDRALQLAAARRGAVRGSSFDGTGITKALFDMISHDIASGRFNISATPRLSMTTRLLPHALNRPCQPTARTSPTRRATLRSRFAD
jgi:hypothetical protein